MQFVLIISVFPCLGTQERGSIANEFMTPAVNNAPPISKAKKTRTGSTKVDRGMRKDLNRNDYCVVESSDFYCSTCGSKKAPLRDASSQTDDNLFILIQGDRQSMVWITSLFYEIDVHLQTLFT